MKKILIVLVFSFVAFGAFGCSGNRRGTEFLVRQVTVGSVTYNYRVYLPKNRRPDEKLPVMLYLHGSGSRGDDNESQIAGFDKFIAENPQNYSFMIVLPQCRSGTFWAGPMAEQAVAALDQTVTEFNGDEKRLYLAGYSMGGYGTWQMGILYPDKFAALVPIAGGIVPNGPLSPEDRATVSPKINALADSGDPYQAFAAELSKKPVWVFHGGSDDVVPVEGSRKMVAALKNAGNNNVNYTEYEGVKHASVEKAFSEPQLFEWLKIQQLK